jgi:hypothetical protein
MWSNPEAWIAIGLSVGFVMAGVLMHRVFVNVLKNEPLQGGSNNVSHESEKKAQS